MVIPDRSDARIEALDICAVLDTPREQMFDNVVFTVAQLFRVSTAALFLVARDRVWPKAAVGLKEGDLDRAALFCEAVIGSGEGLFVEDARSHARFARGMEALGEPALRFCAAAPVLGPGRQRIGVLCALDRQVRQASLRQMSNLDRLAEQAGELLQVRVPGLDVEALKQQARH